MVALAVVALVAAGTRGSAKPTVAGRDVREALVVRHRPLSLDPLVGRADPAVGDVGHLLYRGLLRIGPDAAPQADLAASWGVSGDGLSYRFMLRGGVRWSDGTAVTAHDAAVTVATVQLPGFPDEVLAQQWRGVRCTVDGPDVVTLTLPAPRGAFPAVVAALPVLPAAAVEGMTPAQLVASASRPMATSGPFRVGSVERDGMTLTANPWASPQPLLARLQLRYTDTDAAAAAALRSGQVDAALLSGPAAATLPSRAAITLHRWVSFTFVDLVFNQRRAGLNDAVVRRAIGAAVDRAALVTRALGGAATPQVGAIPAGITWVGQGEHEEPNAPLAARALDAAGWRAGPDGVRQRGAVRLAYTLAVPDADGMPGVGRELARQAAAVGILLTVTAVPAQGYESATLATASFDLALAAWDNGPDPDISAYWLSSATPPHGYNVTGSPPDPFLDQALESLATLSDVALRRAAAARVDALLADGVPAVFLYAPEDVFAVSSSLDGVTTPPVGGGDARYDSVAGWTRSGA